MKLRELGLFLMAIVFCAIFVGNVSLADEDDPVAILGSKALYASDLRHALSNRSLTKKDEEMRVSFLVDWVLQESIAAAAVDFGITVTTNDQYVALSNAYGNESQVLGDLTVVMATLPVALRKALVHPEREKEVYQNLLSGFMSYETWRGHRAYYDTEEEIATLESTRKPRREDLYQATLALERILLKKKVRALVVADITVAEKLVREVYADQYPIGQNPPPFESVRSFIEAQLVEVERDIVWQSWMLDRLRGADVRIYDEDLKSRYRNYLTTISGEAGP